MRKASTLAHHASRNRPAAGKKRALSSPRRLQRAHSIMHAEPQGPVYLMMHRETLTQELKEADIRSYGVAQRDALPRSVADPAHVSRLAEKLLTAQILDHRLWGTQSEHLKGDRGAGRVCRHSGLRAHPGEQHFP